MIHYRFATLEDAPLLGRLNRQLIEDEGHRQRGTPEELAKRMRTWLQADYQAILFEQGEKLVGYVLYRPDECGIYVRQFFVARDHRRQGIGRQAIDWLRREVWQAALRLRLDVLVTNEAGLKFWRAVGFEDYCLILELENQTNEQNR